MYIYVCLCVTQHPFYKSRSNETVLLFPGGAREVFKRKGGEYRLFWPYIYMYICMYVYIRMPVCYPAPFLQI